jgi:hypothetical protein
MPNTSGFEFNDVDESQDPGALMAYLDVTTAQQSVYCGGLRISPSLCVWWSTYSRRGASRNRHRAVCPS